jgi:ABC-type transport system substrate-binding protein
MSKRSPVFMIVALAMIALVGPGCSKSPGERISQPAVITMAVENDLTNLDPIKSQEPYSLRVIGQIFEGLVTLDGTNQLKPALAERWSHNETYDVWTFEIRQGVRFHEDDCFGAKRTREVTAQDVVDSFTRIVSKESYPAFVLADALVGVQEFQEGKSPGVTGLRATGPYTVEMRLQKPEPAFLHRITSPWFCVFPREAVALGPDVFGRTKAIGTGPYKLVSRLDNEVVLDANRDHWSGRVPAYGRVVCRVVKNEQIRLSELRNGNLSLMVLPLALVPAVVKETNAPGGYQLVDDYADKFQVRAFPTFNTHFIGLNCEKMDVHLRRAIAYAVDRGEALQAVAHGAGLLTPGTVPVGLLGYVPPYSGDIHDPERARAELAQSGFNPAKDHIELLVHEKNSAEQLGQLIQAQLGRVGIPVQIVMLDYNAVIGRMIQGDTQAFVLALEYVFSAPEPILNNIFNSEKIPVPNFWRYSNPAVDAGLARLRTVGDRAEANAIARDIEKTIVDDAPAVFLYQLSNPVIARKDIGGLAVNGHSIPLLWEAAPVR